MLSRELGVRFNSIGEAVDRLLADGYAAVREPDDPRGLAREKGRGRPAEYVVLTGGPDRLVGVAISRGRLEVATTDLLGRVVGPVVRDRVSVGARAGSATAVERAAARVAEACEACAAVVGVGVSVPGLVELDEGGGRLLFSAAQPNARGASLSSLVAAAGGRPVVVDNVVQSAAETWRLSDAAAPDQDVLFVSVGDGELGASVMLRGAGNAGCVRGANEMGHMALPVKTARCYCGQIGCVERVVSTAQLRLRDPDETRRLRAALEAETLGAAGRWVLGHLARVVAGSVNLLRPDRLVLTGSLMGSPTVLARLEERVRRRVLPVLRERVLIEGWQPQRGTVGGASWASSLALSHVTGGREALPESVGLGRFG